MITHLVDSLDKNPDIKFVQTYHEQTASIAAEGYALESGKFGVAISTSGPGATSMITGIADAYFGSVPVLYITGQVNTYEYKYDKPIRQQGFQETDVVSICRPVTKYAALVDSADNIRYELEKALDIAISGRKGPVLLDIPMDIQRTQVDPFELRKYSCSQKAVVDFSNWQAIENLIFRAKRPMLLLGGGCRDCDVKLLEELIHHYQWPVITSLQGRGIIDETYPYYLGMLGSYGNRCANMSVPNIDVLIALGTRLDTRQTGAMLEAFMPAGKIIHVDIDENELRSHRLRNRILICSDVNEFLHKLNSGRRIATFNMSWRTHLAELKEEYNQDCEIDRFVENKSPYRLMQYLNTLMQAGDMVCTDVGQNQMWAAQTLKLKYGQHFFSSGGLAPMGFSMPAAIGCAFACPGKAIYSINGDGGFHMATQSLMLISQYNLPIKVIVVNNKALGMITQFQHLYFSDRMAGTTSEGGYYVPSIEKMAEAYGLCYFRLDESSLGDESLKEYIINCQNCIIEYMVQWFTTVSPKLEYNKPISKPSPQLIDKEYDKIIHQ
ncbi:MAG: thiamine pyrophosphate-binding protein [Bacteroides sp.]|nr:thiamine pyrophosphate-binding protein [Tannerellaceae bacterium]MCD8181738.1 thiamine pyrophosphate-binding protein [Bacteroides sp.]